MRAHSNKNFFQPRARLLLQLGDKLIKNENIALLELIKNSYDADSRTVKLNLEKITSKKYGKIDLIDNGEGMDIKIIENVWLEPGSDYKAQLFHSRVRTKKYKRLPIGEKGIGRFGVHKLGNKIELISRKKDCYEVVVRIDWNEFAKNKYLKDAKFEVFERTPEYFLRNRTGTRIIITDLRTDWDRRMIRELYKSVFTLNSPFQKSGNFKVNINIDDTSLLDNLPKWEDIHKFSLWHFRSKLVGTEIKEFSYEFTPWDTMYELEPRNITHKDNFIDNNSLITVKSKEKPKKEIVIDLSKNYGTDEEPKGIGEVNFEGYIFDRDKITLELSNFYGISLLKQYLNEQGGIRVYRDNIRINEYGEKGNDWLSLDIRRVNVPTVRISNNIILGVIDLKLEESTALIEKTNREGFIENEAFSDFCAAILYTLNLIETLRKEDKDLIRAKYNPSEPEEPVLYHLGELKTLIDKNIKEETLKQEINKHLVKIEDDYNQINEVLLASAGAGLAFGVSVHEIQKIISEIKVIVKNEVVSERILGLVKHLDELVENYSDLLRENENEDENILEIIKGALFNVEYRLDAHNVNIQKAFLEYNGEKVLKCSRRLLLGAIINIIDNSIYWLEKKKKKVESTNQTFEKKIFINVFDSKNGYLDILIADNGFGFDLSLQKITKPFTTSKPGGMGLGLHIAKEIMKAQEGFISFPDVDDYEMPSEFQRGAKVVLKLRYKNYDTPQ